MVMAIQPIVDAIADLKSQRDYDEVIYLTPDGERLGQSRVNQLSLSGNLLMLCGHYKGIDQRIRDHVITLELSIGDYVLTGGELPAMVMIDAIARMIPGVLGNPDSLAEESFTDGLLEGPVFTRPFSFQGWEVPEVLRSGHHGRIESWRREQALARTRAVRPDLLAEDAADDS